MLDTDRDVVSQGVERHAVQFAGVIHAGRMLAVGTLDELRERTGAEWLEDVFKALVAEAGE